MGFGPFGSSHNYSVVYITIITFYIILPVHRGGEWRVWSAGGDCINRYI